MSDIDAELMRKAIELGRQGDPSPNPHVGALVVVGGVVVGEGFHTEAGAPHAEIDALNQAGGQARGGTMYVSMEPCNHEGRTPPCVDAILKAGIKRIVIGVRDPNPAVKGKGVERLQEAGVDVVLGVEEEAAQKLVKPWAKYISEGIAYVSLKLGVSLDGRTASRTGTSRWVTGEEARVRVHSLRAINDAVMVGINTVLTDDPQLTVRDVEGRNPIRCVIDSGLRLPMESHLVTTAAETPTCVITTQDASPSLEEALSEAGVSVIRVSSTAEGRVDMTAALRALAAREVVSVLCEGGAELAGSLFAARLPDELHMFVAPILLGPRGRPAAVDWAGPESPDAAPLISPVSWELCGNDAYVHGPVRYPKKKISAVSD
jgi:diaminohydroxyphosphoribosylaminopyrimidine deaminase / 5-amino-6-(5-phosphoribosylamino)uracil reductase